MGNAGILVGVKSELLQLLEDYPRVFQAGLASGDHAGDPKIVLQFCARLHHAIDLLAPPAKADPGGGVPDEYVPLDQPTALEVSPVPSFVSPEWWRTDPPGVVRFFFTLAKDALGRCINLITERRCNPADQQMVDTLLRMHNDVLERTGIQSFMRQYVMPTHTVQFGQVSSDCWHTLAVITAARFDEYCRKGSFDGAVSNLQHYLWGTQAPTVPLADALRGILVEVDAESRRAEAVFPELLVAAARLAAKQEDKKRPKHSADFSHVHWPDGRDFYFTQTQAACVKLLWEAWENGTPVLHQKSVLTHTEVDSESEQLKDVFKDSRAWGTIIVPGPLRGTYRLADSP
jgi:hypothetical protein